MKLSSRKKLLQEADDVLKDISKRRVDELDIDAYRAALKFKKGESERKINLINWKLNKELGLIEKKYRYKNDPESKQKEIDELVEFAEKLKKHMSYENMKIIPEDPKKQTEIQKIIMNTPPFPEKFEWIKNYAKTLVQDKETGMYYSLQTGMPKLPPDWQGDQLEMLADRDVPRDYSRGWFYNLLRWILYFGAPV